MHILQRHGQVAISLLQQIQERGPEHIDGKNTAGGNKIRASNRGVCSSDAEGNNTSAKHARIKRYPGPTIHPAGLSIFANSTIFTSLQPPQPITLL